MKKAFIDLIKEQGLALLNFSKETQHFLYKVNFVNHHKKELFSGFSNSDLVNNCELWLGDYLEGIKNLKDLQKLPFLTIMQSLLTYSELQTLNTLAPQKLEVASGSKISINYSDYEAPTLSVRLQELFGTYETPKLLNQSIALTIELLSPANRPMQITQDLQSFWTNTYEDVRKDLRGKYKRHYWPENPFEAVATSKTKKRM